MSLVTPKIHWTNRDRWRVMIAVIIAMIFLVGIGFGIGVPSDGGLLAHLRPAVATSVVSSRSGSGDHPSTFSRLDLQVHEQNYCECNK